MREGSRKLVGVGAARLRDLSAQAQEKAPSISFIDELDALGKARGISPVMDGHGEHEQTLNQLLAKLDGFDTQKGVIILEATNRPEILDPALLRPGRFDRQVVLARSDVKGRERILRVHVRYAKLTARGRHHPEQRRRRGDRRAVGYSRLGRQAHRRAHRYGWDHGGARSTEATLSKNTGAEVVYESDPARLIDRLLARYESPDYLCPCLPTSGDPRRR